MDLFSNLPPDAVNFLTGIGVNFTTDLLKSAGRRVAKRFAEPVHLEALREAVAYSLDAALNHDWLTKDETHAYLDLFRDWLLNPAVVGKCLDDDAYNVRCEAVSALAFLVSSDEKMKERFLPWFGTISQQYSHISDKIRKTLAEAYAPLLAGDPELMGHITAMLDSPAWPVRFGAARTLIAMPGGPPAHLIPKLRGLLDDMRGEESWPVRLKVAGLLVNDRDRDITLKAIRTVAEALDYATQPWYGLTHEGTNVRRQATLILGDLEPVYHDPKLFDRLIRVLEEDEDGNVRDAAFNSLMRLAAAPEKKADRSLPPAHDTETIWHDILRQEKNHGTIKLTFRFLNFMF